jgi:hypothetical protein
LLRRHSEDANESLCVHRPELNYGTRSSLVMMLAPAITETQWVWTEGAPCQSSGVERPNLVKELFEN